jgi:hypothetical protein
MGLYSRINKAISYFTEHFLSLLKLILTSPSFFSPHQATKLFLTSPSHQAVSQMLI